MSASTAPSHAQHDRQSRGIRVKILGSIEKLARESLLSLQRGLSLASQYWTRTLEALASEAGRTECTYFGRSDSAHEQILAASYSISTMTW